MVHSSGERARLQPGLDLLQSICLALQMEKKRCCRCRKKKPLDDFHRNQSKPDGRAPSCKDCRKSYHKSYYTDNKDKYTDRRQAQRERIRAVVDAAKDGAACLECGEDHQAVLVFHHRDPSAKEIKLADLSHTGWGLKRVQAEIKKCDLLCLNCHAKKHWRRGSGSHRDCNSR